MARLRPALYRGLSAFHPPLLHLSLPRSMRAAHQRPAHSSPRGISEMEPRGCSARLEIRVAVTSARRQQYRPRMERYTSTDERPFGQPFTALTIFWAAP